ncbi:MAG: hypothetical protein C4567_15110 [Deltaproteobacteria bacterium]|nr:MAG: hypothetical protein C4567_15110 [Deltaproteobacteria bacterium]
MPVVRAFVENTAIALGLGENEANGLTLAAKEVFIHLCRAVLKNGERVEIRCSNGSYYVQADFIFPFSPGLELHAFNLNTAASAAEDAGLQETGLVLASRSADRFMITRLEGKELKLTLLKEKAYPPFEESPLALPKPMDEFSVRPPNPEELKLFAHLVKACYRDQALPEVFNYPGKLVDMAGGANYDAAIAVGPAGEIGGGTFWHRSGKRSVEFFGPYLFNQNAGSPIGAALLESCIGAIIKTDAVVLLNRFARAEFAREHFEFLGGVSVYTREGKPGRREAWFRLLHEDLGSLAWVHPEIEDFLREQYERLVLPREIRRVTDEGEQHPRHSVLSATIDRSHASATLRPMWFGTDFAENLGRHLKLLSQEEILNVFFFLDAGKSWQAAFTPGLIENRFKPCMIFPCWGAGDVAVFQFQGAVQ